MIQKMPSKRGNRELFPIYMGLVLDEWEESASWQSITEDMTIEWGSTRGLVTAYGFLAHHGFTQLAS